MPIGKGNVNKPNPLAVTPTERLYEEASIPEDKPFDSLAFIMAYESGELSDDKIIAGFQELVNSGLAWSLQGSYGRMARALIDAGYIHAKE